MSEPFDPRNMPGAAAFWESFTKASKSLQTFASEMQNASKESMDAGSEFLEQLRHVKTMEEAVSLQTAFVQKSLSNYTDYTRRFGELMMALPMEMAKQGRAVVEQGADAMAKATQDGIDQAKKAADDLPSGHG